jgi:quercetin dioxygenase-like cupin family protein
MKKLLFALTLLGIGLSAQEADKPVVSKASTQKYAPGKDVPDCVTIAILRGDPATGPSVFEIKFTAGCLVPWHWHSINEHAIPLSGLIEISMKDEKPALIANGDYNYLPAKHIHQDKCSGSKPCAAIVVVDGPFDIHYVDKSGAEIPAEKAVAEAEKIMAKQGVRPAAKP